MRRWSMVLSFFVLMALSVPPAPTAIGQVFVTVRGKEPIPVEGFKTWSLLLVTNQDWLVPANAGRLQDLYESRTLSVTC